MLDRDFYHNETTRDMIHALTTAKLGVIHRISSVCDVGDLVPENDIGDSSTTTTPQPTDETENDDEGALKWNFYNSVFFSFTVITTIGKFIKFSSQHLNCLLYLCELMTNSNSAFFYA